MMKLGAVQKSPRVRMSSSKVTKNCDILFGSRPLGCGPHVACFSRAILGALYASEKISACYLVNTCHTWVL